MLNWENITRNVLAAKSLPRRLHAQNRCQDVHAEQDDVGPATSAGDLHPAELCEVGLQRLDLAIAELRQHGSDDGTQSTAGVIMFGFLGCLL